MATTTRTTSSEPIQRPAGGSPRGHRSLWVAAAAVSVAAATMGAVLTLDGSSTDRPAPAPGLPAAADDPALSADIGIMSADAAERRSLTAQAAKVDRCSGLSADSAERCMFAG